MWLLRASLSHRICHVAWNQMPAHYEPQHSHIYRPAKRGRDFSALWPWNRAFQRKGTEASLRRNRNNLVFKCTPNFPKMSSVSFLTPSLTALVLKHGCVFQNPKGFTELSKRNYFHLIQEHGSAEWTLAASWITEVPLLPFTVGKFRPECFCSNSIMHGREQTLLLLFPLSLKNSTSFFISNYFSAKAAWGRWDTY